MKRTSWITWRIYFATVPIDVLVLIFAADHRLKSWSEVITWGLVALFSHIVLLPFVAFGVLQSEKLRDWKFDLVFLFILGAIRGIAINFCVSKFNLVPTVSPSYKIFDASVALPQWFVGVALFIESKRQYEQSFRDLFAKAMIKEQENCHRNSILSEGNATDEIILRLQYITSNIASEIQNILKRPKDLADYSIEASKIQHLIDEDIRPTSASLWNHSKINTPKIPFKMLLSISLLESRLRVPLVMAISIPYLFVGLNGVYGVEVALFQCVLIFLIDMFAFGLSEILFKLNWLNRARANLFTLLASFAIALPIQLNAVPKIEIMVDDSSTIFFYQLLLSTTYVMLLLAVNGYLVTSNQRTGVIQSLERYLNEDKFQASVTEGAKAQRNTELAQYLHGEVQAGLTASSLLLQRAAESGDSDLAQEALERASGLLNQDLANISYTRMAPPELKIGKIINAWKGIADITVDLPSYDQLEEHVFRNAVKLIEESIANAIRHAKADVIKISGVIKNEVLSITIISNGNPMTKGKAGLGTQLFDDLSADWNYASELGHNRLTFTLINKV